MQALMLLDENHPSTHTQESGKQDESNNESKYDIANEKTQKAPSYSTCSPIDVSSLQTHEFKGLLKPLENWIILESFLVYVIHIQGLETKEQRQALSCCDEEDTSTYNQSSVKYLVSEVRIADLLLIFSKAFSLKELFPCFKCSMSL